MIILPGKTPVTPSSIATARRCKISQSPGISDENLRRPWLFYGALWRFYSVSSWRLISLHSHSAYTACIELTRLAQYTLTALPLRRRRFVCIPCSNPKVTTLHLQNLCIGKQWPCLIVHISNGVVGSYCAVTATSQHCRRPYCVATATSRRPHYALIRTPSDSVCFEHVEVRTVARRSMKYHGIQWRCLHFYGAQVGVLDCFRTLWERCPGVTAT